MNTKRLKELVEKSKLTKIQLSERCGFTRVTLDKVLQGADVKLSTIESLAKVLNVDVSYLLSEDPTSAINRKCISKYAGEDTPNTAHHTENPKEGIPLIPLSAMAGSLTFDQTILEYECERYIVPAFKGADFLIAVKGDSMTPTYNSGDIVACMRVPKEGLFFQWNHVYVLDTDQGPLIKKVKKGSEPGYISLVSENEEYDPFELPTERIHEVALVIGLIRIE